MMPTRRHDQSPNDSGEDSDIQEIAIIMPGERNKTTLSDQDGPSRVLKRRKSSPQMDPIPTYAPSASLHNLTEQRAPGDTYGSHPAQPTNRLQADAYCPAQALFNSSPIYSSIDNDHARPAYSSSRSIPRSSSSSVAQASSRHSHRDDEYVPSLHPDPDLVSISCTLDNSPAPPRRPSVPSTNQRRSSSSSSVPRPWVISSALAQAVSRQRNSLTQQKDLLPQKLVKSSISSSSYHPAHKPVSDFYDKVPVSNEYAETPVMWSPKVRSATEKAKSAKEKEDTSDKSPISAEDYAKFQSVRPPKQRVAHKPTIPKNKQNRPKMPLGTSRKVPLAFRIKYLDVIINEYLNTGHKEEDSYQDGLNDEKALADRASSKNIYVNLVAGLKKKIREKAGISTLPPDDDPKYVNGNKVVSHEEILTGKVKGSFSIERKRKVSDPSDLNEQELYDRLQRYLMPHDQLVAYGYPHRDPDNPKLRMAPLGKDGQKQQLREELAPSYICERCAKSYRVGEDGLPLTTNKCIFHPGHLWNERINRSLEKRYSCCKGDLSAGGCSSNLYHVHKGELELENYMGYVETEQKDERNPNRHGIYALDCEMSYTTYGLELTRVTVVDHKCDVVYEKLVKPKNPILDYNTKYSGIKPGDLDHVDTSLHDVQRDLLRKFSSKTILVGHSLDSDLRALKIFHKHVIDTAQLFPHKRGLPFKRALRTLMVENLKVIIQEDAGHDSKEDACAAFRLVMWKAKTDVPAKSS